MASPVGGSYSAASGRPIGGGRYTLTSLLDLIAAAPENSWVLCNSNNFDDVWSPVGLRPRYPSSTATDPSSPSAIINAWCSFAWDDVNCRMILFGGGHANTNLNEVYAWDGGSRQWSLAFHGSDFNSVYDPVDGTLNAPVSAHTFGGNQWLPTIQRFISFGGADQPGGSAWDVNDANGSALRLAGGYTLNMKNAGKGYVGGTTGSNPKFGAHAGVSLPGARAWKVRDYYLDHPDGTNVAFMLNHSSHATAYRKEGGRDVLYVPTGAAGASPNLMRIEFVDPDDHTKDLISRVGYTWTAGTYWQGGDLDSTANVFMQLNGRNNNLMEGWNLNATGNGLRIIQVPESAATGPAAATVVGLVHLSGEQAMCFDERRNYFALWGRGGSVYSIKTPANLANILTDWYCDTVATPTSPRPMTMSELTALAEEDSGAMGKWKRSAYLDVYIALQGRNLGNVWMFKPANWVDPRA